MELAIKNRILKVGVILWNCVFQAGGEPIVDGR